MVTNEASIDRGLSIVDSPSSTLCLCTGPLGCSPKDDIPKLVRKYSAISASGSRTFGT